jgi:hypothetical protein
MTSTKYVHTVLYCTYLYGEQGDWRAWYGLVSSLLLDGWLDIEHRDEATVKWTKG